MSSSRPGARCWPLRRPLSETINKNILHGQVLAKIIILVSVVSLVLSQQLVAGGNVQTIEGNNVTDAPATVAAISGDGSPDSGSVAGAGAVAGSGAGTDASVGSVSGADAEPSAGAGEGTAKNASLPADQQVTAKPASAARSYQETGEHLVAPVRVEPPVSCMSLRQESLQGDCIPAMDCIEHFEADIDTCFGGVGAPNRWAKGGGNQHSVCCFNHTIPNVVDFFNEDEDEQHSLLLSQIGLANWDHGQHQDSFKSSPRGLSLESGEKSAEKVWTFVHNVLVAIAEHLKGGGAIKKNDDQSEENTNLAPSAEVNLGVNLATSQMSQFGFSKQLQVAVQHLDMIQYHLTKRTSHQSRQVLAKRKPQLSHYELEAICLAEPRCESEFAYRTIDGSCNNLNYPLLGSVNTAYERLMLPTYDDGFQAPRHRGISGKPLPNARVASVSTFGTADDQSRVLTQMAAFFGQFLAHDMTFGALEFLAESNPTIVDCCQENIKHNVACDPIYVSPTDHFYGPFKKCLNFVRTTQAPPTMSECHLGPREQMNAVTHWLDLSPVYGSTREESYKLRNLTHGTLMGDLTRLDHGGESFLPDDTETPGCQHKTGPSDLIVAPKVKCFLAGDKRLNQTPNLALLHTIFWRLHNKLSLGLARVNPHWSVEHNYQEARRLNVALYQNVVYREFLPVLIGSPFMEHFQLQIRTQAAHTKVYQPERRWGASLNEWAHGAYRLHNLVWGLFTAQDDHGMPKAKPRPLWQVFNQPSVLLRLFKATLNSMLLQGSGHWDANMPDDIHGRLFQKEGEPVGQDLLAIDIQRGRDHGLPGYARIHEACGLGPMSEWDHLAAWMEPLAVARLRQVYRHVQDIDLVVGGQLERQSKGASIGPTLACLLGEQFRRTRFGDRFFYDNLLQPHPFSATQLQAIKRWASMASIVCHVGHLSQAQLYPFVVPTQNRNKPVPCDQIPFIDLELWRETRY